VSSRPPVWIYRLLSLSLVALTTACGSSRDAERWFAADPQLQESSPEVVSSPEAELPSPVETPETVKLPNNFPDVLPRYPNAELIETRLKSVDIGTQMLWKTEDTADKVTAFYREAFASDEWEIVEPFPEDTQASELTTVVRREDLQATVIIPQGESNSTQFTLQYKWDNNTAQTDSKSAAIEQKGTSTGTVAGLDGVGEPIRQYIKDLAVLGVFESSVAQNFRPNEVIKRAEFARWLVEANNLIYANNPGKQIRLIANATQPAFQDVPKTHADFAVIQGLAEAGIIPSQLSGDTTATLFRPDAPLTRETLLLWKVPLDVRQGLPNASLDTIQKTWGFQDTTKIDPKVLRSLLADYQNADQANIKRAFGFTQLFQPKKPVTRAEAAAALWYFGYQGEGITAADALPE
jgi:hypothetical protein